MVYVHLKAETVETSFYDFFFFFVKRDITVTFIIRSYGNEWPRILSFSPNFSLRNVSRDDGSIGPKMTKIADILLRKTKFASLTMVASLVRLP